MTIDKETQKVQDWMLDYKILEYQNGCKVLSENFFNVLYSNLEQHEPRRAITISVNAYCYQASVTEKSLFCGYIISCLIDANIPLGNYLKKTVGNNSSQINKFIKKHGIRDITDAVNRVKTEKELI
jgi:hypothetical protein